MPESLTTAFIQQNWDAYSDEQHKVWATLYSRRMPSLRDTASRVFLDGPRRSGWMQP